VAAVPGTPAPRPVPSPVVTACPPDLSAGACRVADSPVHRSG